MIFDRMLWLNPSDNQGVRFLVEEVRTRTAWGRIARNGTERPITSRNQSPVHSRDILCCPQDVADSQNAPWSSLFAAANALRELGPWEWMDDNQVFGVKVQRRVKWPGGRLGMKGEVLDWLRTLARRVWTFTEESNREGSGPFR